MGNSTTVAKTELRRDCKRIRAGLTEQQRLSASALVCKHIEEWAHFRNAEIILTYLPFKGEVDLTALLRDHPAKVWAAPRIKPGGLMDFHVYDPQKLVQHSFGMWEPAPDCPIITPKQVELSLVPGLAFDGDGWRLGYGGGFYDRFLSQYQGISAGITYQTLLLDHIPHAEHDIPMQYVITEAAIRP